MRKLYFNMINNNTITINVDKEEHDRVLEVLDKFRPHQKDNQGFPVPVRTEGILFVQSSNGPAHMINLETFVDLTVYYEK